MTKEECTMLSKTMQEAINGQIKTDA